MEFNTGGTADSSNSGAMTGGTMASSMYKNGGGMGNYKLTLKSWDADVYEDDYNEGEGSQVNSFNEKVNKSFSNGEELLKYISNNILYHDAKKEHYSIMDDGRIVTSILVDEDNSAASESQIEKWKKGDKKLYSANYNFYVTLTQEKTPSADELSKLLGIDVYKKGGKIKKYANGGRLKPIPKGNKGLPKLPKSVRNKMGYMAKGGGVGKMEWGGTAESSETGEFIGGENQSSMYARGGHVSKGEMVWKKLKSSDKIQFLYENFTPEITPRSQEILVGKAWNFLPKNVKIKFQAKYANVENYGEGGGTGVSSESGTTIGGENQSSMFENGGVSTGFTYDIGGL